MTPIRSAYMPLASYPEAVADAAIRAATAFAPVLAGRLQAAIFAVDVPQVSSVLGNLVFDIPGLVRTVEDRNRAECARLEAVAREGADAQSPVECAIRRVAPAAVLDAAAVEARYHDLSLLPWAAGIAAAQDMAQAVAFGSGRPAVLVPDSAEAAPLDHIAIAWDGSRVAARALGDALPLLAAGGRVSVLTIRDEKLLPGPGIAATLAAALQQRGLNAEAVEAGLQKRPIAVALQETALAGGAQLLALGGFGHSRIRDFVLGGATRGVLTDLRLPVLISH